MHPSYVPIDAEVLRRFYANELLTMEAIAARLGCSATTVLRRLRRFGIPVRPKGPLPRRQMCNTPIRWDPEIAYGVGLVATDGNLSGDKRHMSVTSKDQDLLETLRRCLRVTASISEVRSAAGRSYHKVQWCDRVLYDWFLNIGLTPAKSLTLGPLAVPEQYFADFFRGCIDGDGSVLIYTDRYHVAKNERYVYQRLYVSLVSASRPFPEWIQTMVRRLAGVVGVIEMKFTPGRRPVWLLRDAKRESIRLLRWMYYSPSVPCLARKRAKAEQFLSGTQ